MSEPIGVRAPVENVNDESIAILKWLVQNGDRVEVDAPLLLAETTKTSFDVPAPAAGFVWKVAADQGEVPTGALLCYVGDDLEAVKRAAARETQPDAPKGDGAGQVAPEPADGDTGGGAARFSGKALALLKSLGMDPGEFAGRGLVRERDVLERAAERKASSQAAPAPAPEATRPAPREAARPAAASGVATRVEKLARSKRVEAQYLRSAMAATIPSMATVAVPTAGFFSRSLGRTDLVGLPGAVIIFETSRLLRSYPVFNAFHEDGAVHYYEDVNIGYAVDLGNGLKVPVIRTADRKSVLDIAAEKQQRIVEYINDALPLEALAGGTFTITDLSGEGVFHFNPVLNQGQSAILGVCGEVFVEGSARGLFNLVLAFDHQLAEGRTAAAFLRDLRDRLVAHEQSLGMTGDAPAVEPSCALCLRPLSELQANHEFLIRTIADSAGTEKTVCSVCLQV